MRTAIAVIVLLFGVQHAWGQALQPVVEIEEDVYGFHPADNGSSPMWCYGSTCLVRIGDDVFASGLILFQNIGVSHSQWAFLDRDGNWAATGKLIWPEREDPRFAPYNSTRARVNYPNVVLKDRAVHFCGGSAFNKWERVQDDPELMGRKWSSRWRRLYYTWTPDITTGKFNPWVEIASTHKTGGWLFPADMWLDDDGRVHILWMEYPIGRKLRDEHFPDIRRITGMKYAIVEEGKVVFRRTLVEGGEGLSGVIPTSGRFQVAPAGRLFVFYYVEGTNPSGEMIRENRLMEVHPDGNVGDPVLVPMKHPLGGFLAFFTATTRGGSPPSETLDVLGSRAHTPDTPRTAGKYKQHEMTFPNKISYARIRLW